MLTPQMIGLEHCATTSEHATVLAAAAYASMRNEEAWKAADPAERNGLLSRKQIEKIKGWAKHIPADVLAAACAAYDRQISEGGAGIGWNRTDDNCSAAWRASYTAAQGTL